MLKRAALGASIAMCLIVASCATVGPNEANYTPPAEGVPVKNTVVVDAPFGKVWDHLVEELSSSFFVINNIDKESRLLNVSFSSDTPDKFIDCGRTHREMEYKGRTEDYDYDVAASSTFKGAFKWGPFHNLPAIATVHRNANLSGRMNVYVAPKTDSETTVSVNARYIFSVNVSGVVDSYNAFGGETGENPIPGTTDTITFNTGAPGAKQWGTGAHSEIVRCRSRGVLEGKVLAMASL